MKNGLAISAKDLSRQFGNFVAVNKVNFSIEYGEIFGFLGANGAGKSTTIRMLTGILEPSSGSGTVAGIDVGSDPEGVKKAIGYVSQRFSLYEDLTVQENLEFFGAVYGLNNSLLHERIKNALIKTDLSKWKDQLAGKLSGGMKQRLAVANSILHQPGVLFLDEPTAGIDPVSRRVLWEMLYQFAEEGVALFVTTHYMEEAERCNQIAVISGGNILKIGSPDELKNQVAGKIFEVECKPLLKASHAFRAIPHVAGLTAFGTTLHLNMVDAKNIESTIRDVAKKNGIEVTAIHPIQPSLEDVFATLAEEPHGTS